MRPAFLTWVLMLMALSPKPDLVSMATALALNAVISRRLSADWPRGADPSGTGMGANVVDLSKNFGVSSAHVKEHDVCQISGQEFAGVLHDVQGPIRSVRNVQHAYSFSAGHAISRLRCCSVTATPLLLSLDDTRQQHLMVGTDGLRVLIGCAGESP
jgi:hypothetical protein